MPDLSIRNLSVHTGDGRTILRVPALTLPAGGSLGIRGPSGAGKSTLLHAIAGLTAAEGEVRWGETDIARLGEAERDAFRLEHMGLIFQDFLLFEELSALANAALPACFLPRQQRPAVRKRARALLERFGVPPQRRGVATFSGGERQRVAVARALSTDPHVILADEPTASLDRDNADRLVSELTALARAGGRTLIAVSHDPAVIAAMDRVVDLVDGELRG
jgi:ABC-type lipoprotein export system ATPase subunit